MRRHLVINADDLGLTTAVNDGIFLAHDRGVVTSASLFANAAATCDAITRLRNRPLLGVGCHLTLVDGWSTMPPCRVPTLVDGEGRFRASWKAFRVACLLGKVSLHEVERELTEQVWRLREQGVRVTHLDSHEHVHAYPPIFDIVARVATRFGIPALRVPYERGWSVCAAGPRRRTVRYQAALNAALWPWSGRAYDAAVSLRLRTADFAGRIHCGALTMSVFDQILHRLRPGVTELMVHPGFVDDQLLRMNTQLLDSRREEVNLLCDARIPRLLMDHHIVLTRHDDADVAARGARDVA